MTTWYALFQNDPTPTAESLPGAPIRIASEEAWYTLPVFHQEQPAGTHWAGFTPKAGDRCSYLGTVYVEPIPTPDQAIESIIIQQQRLAAIKAELSSRPREVKLLAIQSACVAIIDKLRPRAYGAV